MTPTISQTPAETVTPTISQTPPETVTPTISVSPTQTVTPTISQTPAETVTPTISVSPTKTVTPTISQTPAETVTPTISVSPTQTVTPTISITPSVSTQVTEPSSDLFTIKVVNQGIIDTKVSVESFDSNQSSDFSWPNGATGFSIEALPKGTFLDDYTKNSDGKYDYYWFAGNEQQAGHLFSLVSGDISGAENYGGFALSNTSINNMQSTSFASLQTTLIPHWIINDANTQLPISSDIHEIPSYFKNHTNSLKGIRDFGLIDCLNSDCSNNQRVATVPNSVFNDNIYFYVKQMSDYDVSTQTDGATSNIGNDTVEIKFSGMWLF